MTLGPSMPAPRRVTVIGYDGGPFVPEALQAISVADLVVGGQRHLDAVGLQEKARTVVMGPLEPALDAVRAAHQAGERVVVLASGDPGLFGIVRRLTAPQQHLPVRVLPAVSSIGAAFGILGVPWDDALVVSAHGRPLVRALNVWRRYQHSPQRVAILTDADSSPASIVQALGAEFAGCEVLELLGEPGERKTTVLPEDPAPDVHDANVIGPGQALAREWLSPNLVVTPAHAFPMPGPPWLLGQRARLQADVVGWALPDEAFGHRDGMLTKREVRAVILSRLAPATGTLVWDIGAGSGSVAVECSRLGSAAIAVERDERALRRIADNCSEHLAPVRVVHGEAPEALKDLPHPDAVFVGGGGPDVVAAVAAVRPERAVVALATVERVAPTIAALEGYHVDTVLLQVQHLAPLGDGHRLSPANPVFVVSGVLP